MTFQTTQVLVSALMPLGIPVPPTPLLEEAVGYNPDSEARYIALWWEPCGDEAMVADGRITFTGNWYGYLAYIRHRTVKPLLAGFNLGSSDEEASFRLVIDRLAQQAFIANPAQAEHLLASQWPQVVVSQQTLELTAETLRVKQLMEGFLEETNLPTWGEIAARMQDDAEKVTALTGWLDGINYEENGGFQWQAE